MRFQRLISEKVSLLPLTASLYVPGRLSDAEKVIVDVGTGYYVEKTREQATHYYKDKIAYTNGRTVIVRYISIYAVAVPDTSQIDRYGISRSVLHMFDVL